MLQASRLKITEGQLATIAGEFAGRKVLCTPQALPVFNALVSLAGSGNYWARLIVQGIRGLTSGRLHMDSIYPTAYWGSIGGVGKKNTTIN